MAWTNMTEAGAWIGPRLTAFGTGAASVVPAGFERYARVLHPAGGQGDEPGTPWSVVADWGDATVDAASTWLDVALPQHRPAAPLPWDGSGPDTGAYPSTVSTALLEVLTGHTADPSDVWAGVWEGWGDTPVPIDLARLHHPARAYVLRHGTLTSTARIDTASTWPSRPPSLWWPGDRSWCVATEIDADQTFVGGSARLLDAVVAHPGLEAHPIDPTATPLKLTAPRWLHEVLAHTATQLLETGQASLVLSRGTLTATWIAPRRTRSGELSIASTDDHGGRRGASSVQLSTADLHTRLSAALLWSAYDLTT